MSTPADNQTLQSDDPATPKRRLGPSYFKLFAASTISNLGDGVGAHRLPVAGLGGHPQSDPDRPRGRRAAPAVAGVHAARRRDHRPRRSPHADGLIERGPRTCSPLAVAFAVLGRQGRCPARTWCPTRRSSIPTQHGPVRRHPPRHAAARRRRGAARQLGPDDHARRSSTPTSSRRPTGGCGAPSMVANTFVGPPLGALLIAVSFACRSSSTPPRSPSSAALDRADPPGRARPAHDDAPSGSRGRPNSAEGFRWLWHHELLRPMAIILGILNALGMVTVAIARAVRPGGARTPGPTAFAVLTTGGAIGGVIGGWTAASVSPAARHRPVAVAHPDHERRHDARHRAGELVAGWCWLLFGIEMGVGVLWNVITVSLRQSIIPDHLLGRVNSVYRFFAWGMMPIGSLIGGLIVVVTDAFGAARAGPAHAVADRRERRTSCCSSSPRRN